MKRTPLKRGKPLERGRKAINAVSTKRRGKFPERKALRSDQLFKRPMCEARLEGCSSKATDVHEIVNRSQDKESWLKPELFLSLCRLCHKWVTEHPMWSRHHGYTLSRYQQEPKWLVAATAARVACRNRECLIDHLKENI
jgi:hypothetical protein